MIEILTAIGAGTILGTIVKTLLDYFLSRGKVSFEEAQSLRKELSDAVVLLETQGQARDKQIQDMRTSYEEQIASLKKIYDEKIDRMEKKMDDMKDEVDDWRTKYFLLYRKYNFVLVELRKNNIIVPDFSLFEGEK